jgi:type I restriction-modification system DNA methylase subunit
MTSITNSDDLRVKIHEIHNYMRNNGIGYGLSSLKVFNFLYGLMKIEEFNNDNKDNLVKFSTLLEMANEYSNMTNDKLQKYLDIIIGDEKLRQLVFYEIPIDIRDDVYNHLIKEIYSIKEVEKTSNELLSGKIYEYFIGRDQTAISELGAYFTNRRIVNFILNKIKIKINNDGSIPKMIDMFGGSGGFTTGYMMYLNKTYKIDWNKELNKIYHYDINDDVLKSAGLELFCLSNGILPNMGHNNNIRKVNSFKHNFETENKFDIILTNPPFGGDKKTATSTKDKRDKIKNYIKEELKKLDNQEIINYRKKQLKDIEIEEKKEKKIFESQTVNLSSCSKRLQTFAKLNNLIGNDKEACSLMMMMELLDVNGIAGGVIKEGLLFDSKYKDLRKYLLLNYNIKSVISVPQNQFENTSTKTSIIIFENTEIKTSNIEFTELVVYIYEEDKFIDENNEIKLIINKGDIKEIREVFIKTVSIDEILNNDNISLNSNDYNKVSIIPGEGFELVKIKDICEFHKYKSQKEDIDGIFNYYSCSSIIKKCNNPTINGEFVLLGTRGTIIEALHYINGEFGCNNNMLIFNAKKNNNIYLYYIIKIIKVLINTYITGSTIPMISKEKFQELEIPIPKTPELIEYWENKISQPFMKKQEKERRFKEVEEEIIRSIKDIEEKYECQNFKLGEIINYISKKNKYNAHDGYKNGLYRFYTSSQTNILYRDDYEFEESHILLGRGGNISIHLANKFSVSHDDVYVINTKKSLNLYYLYYLLINNKNLIVETFKGSTIKHTSKTKLNEIKIKLPKDKTLIDNLEPLFNEVEEIQKEIKNLDENYNKYLQELSKSAIKNQEILNKDI